MKFFCLQLNFCFFCSTAYLDPQSPQATAGTDGFLIHNHQGTKHQTYAQTNLARNTDKKSRKRHQLRLFFTHIDS